MRARVRRVCQRLMALVVVAAVIGVPRGAAAQGRLVDGFTVIGNVPGVESLARAEVIQLMRGERALWGRGVAVTVVLPSGRSPLIDAVAREVFGLSKAGLQRYWLSLVFQGRATPPVQFDSAEEMAAFVRRTPGAIAVVPGPIPEAAQAFVIRVR